MLILPANVRGATDSGLWPNKGTEAEALRDGLGPVLAAQREMTTAAKTPMVNQMSLSITVAGPTDPWSFSMPEMTSVRPA